MIILERPGPGLFHCNLSDGEHSSNLRVLPARPSSGHTGCPAVKQLTGSYTEELG